MYGELFRGCKAENLKVITSRLYYEIRQNELREATGCKLPADAAFIVDKRHATATVLREKIKDTFRISLYPACSLSLSLSLSLSRIVHSRTDYFSPSIYFCGSVFMCLRRTVLQVYCEGIFGNVTSHAAEKIVLMAKVSLKCEIIALLRINY